MLQLGLFHGGAQELARVGVDAAVYKKPGRMVDLLFDVWVLEFHPQEAAWAETICQRVISVCPEGREDRTIELPGEGIA